VNSNLTIKSMSSDERSLIIDGLCTLIDSLKSEAKSDPHVRASNLRAVTRCERLLNRLHGAPVIALAQWSEQP
jgi:hypothetical protein